MHAFLIFPAPAFVYVCFINTRINDLLSDADIYVGLYYPSCEYANEDQAGAGCDAIA